MADLVLFPHCDMHVALAGAPQLTVQVCFRTDDPAHPGRFLLTPTNNYRFDFFAPHGAVGHRLEHLPIVNNNLGLVIPTTPGTFLFQLTAGQHYLVGRLQVHNSIVAWWFGNDSITTAVDPTIAHAQPSIYAKFSDDPTGTDLIGDITGHGYVPLTSSDTSKVVVDAARGRLRGVVETANPVNISGTFLGQTNTMPVRVVNYAKTRRDLVPIQAPGVAQAQEKHNIVFLSEGFRDTPDDRKLFDEVVTRATEAMFSKPRHQPYAMLEGSFNIFKAFAPSQQHVTTCGFRVTDTAADPVPSGSPIPFNGLVGEDKTKYTVEELVRRVGLPMRGENRPNLKALWGTQNLNDFNANKVTDELIAVWKAQQSVGILHARDTSFGMYLGARLADRLSGGGPVAVPAADAPADAALAPFIARVYEFYRTLPTRTLTADPRRHPPELYAGFGFTNPANSILAYLGGLQYTFPPFTPVGQAWIPDDTTFKPSRGLVALITNDGVIGGTNINNNTLTALTLSSGGSLRFAYANPNDKREMRRDPPSTIDAEHDDIVNVVAHEFGHSFNLLDEYEDFGDHDPTDASVDDLTGDNVTRIGFIRLGAPPSQDVDRDKVKWFDLLLMSLSDRLLVDSTSVGGGIQVTIDPRHIGKWVQAKADQAGVHLRNFNVSATGRQLPLLFTDNQYLTDLVIGDIDQVNGRIVLGGPELPPAPFPVFKAGSGVFVPQRDKQGGLVFAVEKKVLDDLHTRPRPLNDDPNTASPNREVDHPRDIPGFNTPCKSAKLVGIFEGAVHYAAGNFRPTGQCKMRNAHTNDDEGEFCFICKWLIVNRVDPGYHSIISKLFYPRAKKNG